MEPSVKMQYKALFRKIMAKSVIISDIFIESEYEVKIKSQLPGHIVKTAITEGVPL